MHHDAVVLNIASRNATSRRAISDASAMHDNGGHHVRHTLTRSGNEEFTRERHITA